MAASTVAALVLLMRLATVAAPPPGMALPVPAQELAAAIGLARADTANLPLDLVRALYATEAPTASTRAAVARLLAAPDTPGGERVPLPLGAAVWRERILHAAVEDGRIAAAILGSRPNALLYHGLLGVDRETLEWFAANPDVLDRLRRRPGIAAVFARSLHVHGGAVVTPGDRAQAVWAALVGEDPSRPGAFITRLLDARDGRLAYLYDTIAHLDAAHQKFALTAARGATAVARAQALLDVAAEMAPSWKVDERPFFRPDLDVALVLASLGVDGEGTLDGLSARGLWERAFGERARSGPGDGTPVDAAWLAARILRVPMAVGRRRLDAFLFAQRTLMGSTGEPAVDAIRGVTRYPALMLTLERNGVRGAAPFATAARAARGLDRDPDGLLLLQSLLATVDVCRAAGTVPIATAAQLTAALVDAGLSGRAAMTGWAGAVLLPALRMAVGAPREATAEAVVVSAAGGRLLREPPAIEWEGRRYAVDPAVAERARIARIRRAQGEPALDGALREPSAASSPRELADSPSALVYAVALGEPDGQAAGGGAVWKRHRLRASGRFDEAWRTASESFGADGWHLAGSLLALETAMPRLALRRLDAGAVPVATQLSTTDRHVLELTVALFERGAIGDEAQRACAAAIGRGSDRVRALMADPASWQTVAREAGLSDWRANGIAWMLATDPARVPALFTLAELHRIGSRGTLPAAYGGAALPLDGSLSRRPVDSPWEEFTGRPTTGLLGSRLVDVQLRTALALDELRLPASILRDVAAFAMQEVLDTARLAYFDDYLTLAFAARDLNRARFEDYVAALTASGPLVPLARN